MCKCESASKTGSAWKGDSSWLNRICWITGYSAFVTHPTVPAVTLHGAAVSTEFGPGRRSSLENFVWSSVTDHQACPRTMCLFPRGPLSTETLTEENLLIKDQNHPDTAAMMPSMWPLGWQDSIPAWTWVVPSLLFSRKDGEVGVKETKLRLAGRAGFNCNFMSLHLRALLKSQCKSFIFWIYF